MHKPEPKACAIVAAGHLGLSLKRGCFLVFSQNFCNLRAAVSYNITYMAYLWCIRDSCGIVRRLM